MTLARLDCIILVPMRQRGNAVQTRQRHEQNTLCSIRIGKISIAFSQIKDFKLFKGSCSSNLLILILIAISQNVATLTKLVLSGFSIQLLAVNPKWLSP
jgi:hypothetical protein